MTRRASVDATPCFLPLFLLFGGIAGGRATGARPYTEWSHRNPAPVTPGFGPRLGGQQTGPYRPKSPAYYSPWVIHPAPHTSPVAPGTGQQMWF
ncbi:hypothetical protein NZD89_26305 [Alicyclobacillus fastidiosus]|uniref:Secreted protein n=1 Tax=Alicyclobacillus fastidiosus TaxID=392011 RepID=A0ABY6ZG15_9BACL|nr:hypothetical protein [Alicyclobacillus fastidiosus]WAH41680.1 hypothetical protein NZD89_26305 [Alicyclobacillus fastidiosus]GMA63359.1 hypothetical protein GCM10025859_37990 [Alicyclobacillus fastidiosus]